MKRLRSSNFVTGIFFSMLVGQFTTRSQLGEKDKMKEELFEMCSEKYPITEEMKTSANNGIIPEDRIYKCFLKCCFEGVGLIDDQGIIDGETLIEWSTHKSITESVVESCLPNEAGRPDGCETSYNFFVCAMKINQTETVQSLTV